MAQKPAPKPVAKKAPIILKTKVDRKARHDRQMAKKAKRVTTPRGITRENKRRNMGLAAAYAARSTEVSAAV